VGTTLEVTVLLLEVPTGVVADVYSRRLSTIIGFLIMGTGFMIEGSLPVFGAVVLAQVVWGAGWTFISGARSAWLSDEVGQDKVAPVYLRAAQLRQLGLLAGIPISVALGSVRLTLPILFGGVLSVLLGLFLVLFMPEKGFQPAAPEERVTWGAAFQTLRDGLVTVKRRPALLLFLAIGIFVGLSSEGYDRLWTPHILQNFVFPAAFNLNAQSWFGTMRLGSILLTLAFTEITRRRFSAVGFENVVHALQSVYAVMVGGVLLLALTDNVLLAILAYWTVETMRGTASPLSEGWVNQHIDSRVRATVLSMTGQADALGQIVGGPIVGAIGTVFSLRAALAVSSLVLSPVVALYTRIKT
jgi:DHA3 family tetracycline resistance protein-like MFS transporter